MELREQIEILRREGLSYSDIALHLGISLGTVHYNINAKQRNRLAINQKCRNLAMKKLRERHKEEYDKILRDIRGISED